MAAREERRPPRKGRGGECPQLLWLVAVEELRTGGVVPSAASASQPWRLDCEVNRKNIDKLIEEAWQIEQHEARKAGALGFMARSLAIATMPHRKVAGNEYKRTNGSFSLSMLAPSDVGLPFGSVPRLLMTWLTTDALRTKEREIVLGPSLSDFMRKMKIAPTGGEWGSITRLRDQMERLFACSIHGIWRDEKRSKISNFVVAEDADLWWDPKSPEEAALWRSTVLLGEKFFKEIVEHPVPIDLRAVQAIRRSPLAIDIYIWLTYRMSFLREDMEISWPGLQLQFGAGYPMTPQGERNFRKAFRRELKKALFVYQPDPPRVEDTSEYLLIRPSRTHIISAKS